MKAGIVARSVARPCTACGSMPGEDCRTASTIETPRACLYKPLGIGSTVWVFDCNRRVYRDPKPGEIYASGGPIYREHWAPQTIKAETSRSWVLTYGRKIPKAAHDRPSDLCYSERQLDDACWVHDHAYKLSRVVSECRDADVLRRIADWVGFKPT